MNANFREKVASPTKEFWHQKTRVPVLAYGEKNCRKFQPAEYGAPTLQTTDRRQTTDGIATASSEREREFTSAKNVNQMAVLCEMTQYSIRFEAAGYLCTSRLLPAFDNAWCHVPATE